MPDESQSNAQLVVAEGTHLETGETWQSVLVFVPQGALYEISIVTYRSGEIVEKLTLPSHPLQMGFHEQAQIELKYRHGMVKWSVSPEVHTFEEARISEPAASSRRNARTPEARARGKTEPEGEPASNAKDRAIEYPEESASDGANIPDARGHAIESRAIAADAPDWITAPDLTDGETAPPRPEDRATRSPRETQPEGRRERSIIPYGSEIADAVKSHTDQVDRGAALLGKDLQDWLDSNPGLGNVALATAGQTALTVMVGSVHFVSETFVDPLRLGEGANAGGWRGWGEDVLRATAMLPPPKLAAAAGRGVIHVGKGVLAAAARLGLKVFHSGSKARRVRVRPGKTAADELDLYGQSAGPWAAVRGIAGMHRHHLVLKRVFRHCTDPGVRRLEDAIPTVPLERGEHLTELHPALSEYLPKGALTKASYTPEEVVEILQVTSDFYRKVGLEPYARAVDTFVARHFEFF